MGERISELGVSSDSNSTASSESELGGNERFLEDFTDPINSSNECDICREKKGSMRLLRNCGHEFCEECLQRWMKRSQDMRCPHCREYSKFLGTSCRVRHLLIVNPNLVVYPIHPTYPTWPESSNEVRRANLIWRQKDKAETAAAEKRILEAKQDESKKEAELKKDAKETLFIGIGLCTAISGAIYLMERLT